PVPKRRLFYPRVPGRKAITIRRISFHIYETSRAAPSLCPALHVRAVSLFRPRSRTGPAGGGAGGRRADRRRPPPPRGPGTTRHRAPLAGAVPRGAAAGRRRLFVELLPRQRRRSVPAPAVRLRRRERGCRGFRELLRRSPVAATPPRALGGGAGRDRSG